MGINIVKTDRFDTGFVYDRRQVFLLDTVDDFIMLPTDCAPGSEAYTVDMAVQWRVNSYGNWIEMKSDIPTVPTTVSSFENDAGYLTAPATASVGQTITVKSVDESGKPTEWEAADVLTEAKVNELIDAKIAAIPTAEEVSF